MEKKTDIIQKTCTKCTKYDKLGIFLLEDDKSDIVDSLKIKCQGDPEKIATAVYKKWIDGTVRKPVTWQTLIEVLKVIDLNTLASKIELICYTC